MSIGAGHWPFLIIILVIVLVIWGPGKLPELGSGIGRAIREFRKASSEAEQAAAPQSDRARDAQASPAAQSDASVQPAATGTPVDGRAGT